MSEAELHLIRGRLEAGLRHKAAKGELRQALPVGLGYDEAGKVVISPDEAVAATITTVFDRFDELGSARQVLLSLREDGLALPRRPTATGRTVWATATYTGVHAVLTNPLTPARSCSAVPGGSNAWTPTGGWSSRPGRVPREEWAVLIVDHHPGFLTWERYEDNLAQLTANARPPAGHGGGAAREGTALLQGRVRCGRCGRMMQTGYSGRGGNFPRYVCAYAKKLYGGERGCQSLGGRRLEQRVLDEVFTMLAPAALAATAQALGQAQTEHTRRLAAFRAGRRAHATRPTGRAASSTRSSPRTGSWPAPWNAPGSRRWPRCAAPRQTWPPDKPAGRSR